MSAVWNTKFGPRRVRHDPPTLEEAITAASGLTDDLEGQIEIASSLMGMPPDAVRTEVMKTRAKRKGVDTVAVSTRGRARTVIVERRTPRRGLGMKPSL
jgi:hypothetical protein